MDEGLVLRVALPDDERAPTLIMQLGNRPLIPFNGRGEFGLPERWACFRICAVCAPRMTMPEAAMNEESQAVPRKDEVRFAWKIFPMQSVPQPEFLSDTTHGKLGHRVLRPNARHHLATLFRFNNVGHDS